MRSAREYTEWAGQEFPDSDASVFIQWKGTNVCLDFYCPCGRRGHYDGGFAYSVKCPECGRTFDLGTQVRIRETDDPFTDPKELG